MDVCCKFALECVTNGRRFQTVPLKRFTGKFTGLFHCEDEDVTVCRSEVQILNCVDLFVDLSVVESSPNSVAASVGKEPSFNSRSI